VELPGIELGIFSAFPQVNAPGPYSGLQEIASRDMRKHRHVLTVSKRGQSAHAREPRRVHPAEGEITILLI